MKSLFFKLPHNVQREFHWRLRKLKRLPEIVHHRRELNCFELLSTKDKKKWILERIRLICEHAQRHSRFYHELYKTEDFSVDELEVFDDIKKIPIVKKEDLRAAKDHWLRADKNQKYGNTGGTSGNPLKFNLSKDQDIRERFYIEEIFKRIGCEWKHTRAVFRGRNLGEASFKYDSHDDAYYINLYVPFEKKEKDLMDLFSSRKIEYFHGYPSAIADFSRNCLKSKYSNLRNLIMRNLKGILLGSEYPSPQYRDVINRAFPVKSISWYGHSEMTILAAENKTPLLYEVMQPYGFCEAVEFENGQTRLVGTCYDNFDSPFIRYDTGDCVAPEEIDRGLLSSFTVKEGREGEFILDHSLHPISLTALIFGRHHKAFDLVDFIQISQDKPGSATLHVTLNDTVNLEEIGEWFDFINVNVDFTIKQGKEPIRTKNGKVKLLVDCQ
jgi:phenylacetate-CoA ligase